MWIAAPVLVAAATIASLLASRPETHVFHNRAVLAAAVLAALAAVALVQSVRSAGRKARGGGRKRKQQQPWARYYPAGRR